MPSFPASKHSLENVLRDVHDRQTQSLRTTAQASIVIPGGLEVDISHTDDSIAIANPVTNNFLAINPDGSINVLINPAANPFVINLNLTNNTTKYNFTFPLGTKKFFIKSRSTGLLQLAFTDPGPYFSLSPGVTYKEEDLSTNCTIFIQSSKNNDIAEIVYWT